MPGKAATGTSGLDGVRVLVVDDAPDARLLVRTLLERQGSIVEVAENGAVGVEMAVGRYFDVVIMDLTMPILDGIRATERLRTLGYTRPIVTASARDTQADHAISRAAGACAHLTKPFAIDLLFRTVREQAAKVAAG